ncbi:endoglycosidase, partial [Bacteroides ovatus]
TVNKYGYDGFDIDYEPNFGNRGNIVDEDDRMFAFVDELGKYFGPKSGTGKLLVIDGEPQSITGRPEVGLYFDYFIIQAYNNSSPGSDSKLDKRLITGGVAGAGLVQTYSSVMSEEQITKMTIMTENFEATDAAMDGGYDYTDRYGNKMKSLEGMARWQPSNGFRKGGAGTYHMEAEYGTSPEYKNIRRAIQIMNPSSHSLLKN